MRLLVKSIGMLAVMTAAAAGVSRSAAHHDASMFDVSQAEVLKGKLVELRWVNPHVTLSVRGALRSGEAPSEWLMETTSPGNLTRVDGGWRRDAVKPGEEVVSHPLRQPGKRLGLLRQLTTLSNSQVFVTNLGDRQTADLE
jgi:Flp pilus assembly protein CpaB